MNNIPKTILVPVLMAVAVGIVVYTQKPHTACDSQVEVFVESQKGYLFAKTDSAKNKSAQYRRFLSTCREGATPGACMELFMLMKKSMRDLEAAPIECSNQFEELVELRKALADTMEIMVVTAWGSQPPETGTGRYSWLETSDLALFCQVKRNFVRIFGEEDYNQLIGKVHSILPGEPIVLGEDGRCKNCDGEAQRKTAPEVLSPEQIWAKSLFSVRCEQYF